MTELNGLGLNGLGYEGPISPAVGDLVNLSKLTLAHQKLSGDIPQELGNLVNLKDLNLCDNALAGAIPVGLAKLTKVPRSSMLPKHLIFRTWIW